MKRGSPKQIRRQILELLYDRYARDPMHSLLPAELYIESGLAPEDVTPAVFYLHERGYVELLVGYNPPNFDAIRISPKGIDLVEDAAAFIRLFPPSDHGRHAETPSLMPILLQLVKEIEASPLQGARRDWLVEDLKTLRDLLRLPAEAWDAEAIQTQLRRIDEYLDKGLRRELPALRQLNEAVNTELEGD